MVKVKIIADVGDENPIYPKSHDGDDPKEAGHSFCFMAHQSYHRVFYRWATLNEESNRLETRARTDN